MTYQWQEVSLLPLPFVIITLSIAIRIDRLSFDLGFGVGFGCF